MPTYQLLTDRSLAQSSAITPTTLIHIVTTADTSQSIYGSSYKAELQQLSSIFSGNTDTFVTGGTYSNGNAIFTNSTGGTFTVTGLTDGSYYLALSGGTVTGNTVFTQGLTATTISATTYLNLPVSGLTAGSNISITGNNGNFTIAVTGVTGGSSIDPYYNSGSGSTITWDVSGQSTNYEATLTATTTLNLTGVTNGDYGTIIINQDGVGSRTLTLGTVNGLSTTHRVANGGGGVVILTSNASATDILTFTYNGTVMFWTVGNDYT